MNQAHEQGVARGAPVTQRVWYRMYLSSDMATCKSLRRLSSQPFTDPGSIHTSSFLPPFADPKPYGQRSRKQVMCFLPASWSIRIQQLLSGVATAKLLREKLSRICRRTLDGKSAVAVVPLACEAANVESAACGGVWGRHNLGHVAFCQAGRADGAFQLIKLPSPTGLLCREQLLGIVVGREASLDTSSLGAVVAG